MEIITKLSVSLTRDNDTVYVKAKQNDIGRGIEVTLVEHSTVYQLLDTDEVNAYVAKPDGKVVYNPCTVSDGKAVVELTQQMLAKDGRAKCEIEVKRDGKRISNPEFTIIIYPENISDDAILSTDEVGVLEQWYLDQIAAMSPVKYTAQSLTDEQKSQARENIGAAAAGEGGGSGGSVTVDAALSGTSTNPVQNKVVTAELAKKAAKSGYTAGKNVVTDADGNLATEDKPTSLKNPNALTFTGAATGSYDGSEPLSVEIPSGGVGGSAGRSEYELLCDQSFDLDGTGTSVEVQLPASPKGFVLYLAIQVNSPETSDTMTFSVDGASVPSYFGYFALTKSIVTVKKWFCDNIVTHNLTTISAGDSNSLPISISMVRGNVAHSYIGSPTGDGKLVVGVPGKVGTLYIRAYMRY